MVTNPQPAGIAGMEPGLKNRRPRLAKNAAQSAPMAVDFAAPLPLPALGGGGLFPTVTEFAAIGRERRQRMAQAAPEIGHAVTLPSLFAASKPRQKCSCRSRPPPSVLPEMNKPSHTAPGNGRTVSLVSNGDLRLSANQKCWPEQAKMEETLTRALEAEGWTVARAHAYDA